MKVFDDRRCTLGEGALWHPRRKQLFWFDIVEKRLMSQCGDKQLSWAFDDPVSAAAWIDDDALLMASAHGLWSVDLRDGSRAHLCNLEHDNPLTRSNDGRADPFGGFWIGTMGYNAEPGAGAIYRYYKGKVRKLFSPITISNSICFAPDRSAAYFSDTAIQKLMRVALNTDGWPDATPEVLIDFSEDGLNPDGAVTAADGTIWIAQWGSSRVVGYRPDGSRLRTLSVPADQVTCPAFGGDNYETLFVTSASKGLDAGSLKAFPTQGMTFSTADATKGLPEPRVIL
ncbi:MAG: SMP-30/gluconolactonase/LRE family protein [Pseudomonadota bacterium]